MWCRLAVPALWRQTRKDPCYSLAWNWPRRPDWLASEPSGAAFFCLRNAGIAKCVPPCLNYSCCLWRCDWVPCAYKSNALLPGPIFPSFLMKSSFSLDFPKPFNMITRFSMWSLFNHSILSCHAVKHTNLKLMVVLFNALRRSFPT